MKIALLSDVHANLPALDAVLAHARASRIDEYWNLGDMVGYGPFPRECIARLRSVGGRHIRGNHDPKCCSPAHAQRMRARGGDPDKIFSFEWTSAVLSPEDVRFIHGLSETSLCSDAGTTVLLTHGSPVSPVDSLTPRTPAAKFRAIAPLVRAAEAEVMVCGHTHEFFDRTINGIRFINPGGIGRSFDGDPRASYAVLDISARGVQVAHFRVPYDLNTLTTAMTTRGFPLRLVQTFTEARNIEELGGVTNAGEEAVVQAALTVLGHDPAHRAHARRVEALAAAVFDLTRGWHGCSLRERAYLRAAALLHDIGWMYGQEKHHKASRDIILQDTRLPLQERERVMVALIARYHRRSLPSTDHRYFKDINSYEQETVSVLAGMLRIADGLDRSHEGRVRAVSGTVTPSRIILTLTSGRKVDVRPEIEAATTKASLLEKITGSSVVFRTAA